MNELPKKRTPINWEAARARLDELREWSERAGRLRPEQIEAAYRRRAALLAEPLLHDREPSNAEALVIFRAGGERFGVPLSGVSEILPNPPCAPVPGAPPEIAGVIQVRGEIRPVCELWRILGLPAGGGEERPVVLLLRGPSGEFGARIDFVEDIRMQAAAEGHPAPEAFARHTAWVTRDLIPILKIESLFEGKA